MFCLQVSVVLPEAINVPEIIKDSLNEDCDYYKVENLQICELVCMEFIEAFVKKGMTFNTAVGCMLF